VNGTAKPIRRKDRTAEKRQPIPERFSGDGSAPPRLSVWFSTLFVFVACACRGGASAPSLSYQRLSHIFMDTQLLIIAFLRIRTLDKLFEATIALVNFRICN